MFEELNKQIQEKSGNAINLLVGELVTENKHLSITVSKLQELCSTLLLDNKTMRETLDGLESGNCTEEGGDNPE
jgi:regulator of replication initiation timing